MSFKFLARRIGQRSPVWEVEGDAVGEGFAAQLRVRGADMNAAGDAALCALWALAWLAFRTALAQSFEFAAYRLTGAP